MQVTEKMVETATRVHAHETSLPISDDQSEYDFEFNAMRAALEAAFAVAELEEAQNLRRIVGDPRMRVEVPIAAADKESEVMPPDAEHKIPATEASGLDIDIWHPAVQAARDYYVGNIPSVHERRFPKSRGWQLRRVIVGMLRAAWPLLASAPSFDDGLRRAAEILRHQQLRWENSITDDDDPHTPFATLVSDEIEQAIQAILAELSTALEPSREEMLVALKIISEFPITDPGHNQDAANMQSIASALIAQAENAGNPEGTNE